MGFSILFEGNYLERLLLGLWVTAKIAFISVFFACIFGAFLGVLMKSRSRFIRVVTRLYLEFVRLVPLLVLLFVVYFGFAKWFNVHLSGVLVCVLVFVFWGTAEMGDLMRAAITSIERHQVDSAEALGLRSWQVFFYILLPQSIQRVTPGAINLFTRMVKTSSLAMLIGVAEVIKVGQQIIETSLFSNSSAALWVYGVIFILYFLICYPLSLCASYLEKRWER